MSEIDSFHVLQHQPRIRIRDYFRTFIQNHSFGLPTHVKHQSKQERQDISNEAINVASDYYMLTQKYLGNTNRPSILRSARGLFSRLPLIQFIRSYPDFRGDTKDFIPTQELDYSQYINSIKLIPKSKPKEKDAYETLKTKTKGKERFALEDAYKTLHYLPHKTKHTVKKTGYRYRTLAEREKGKRSLY
jgi:hypothetical protein